MDIVHEGLVHDERLKALEAAAVAIKQSRDALKDLAHIVRGELDTLSGPGAVATAVLEQRIRWMVPIAQPMLLCSQVQRSGGTLLTRLFDGHPSCFVHPNELRWGSKTWPRVDLSADVAVMFDEVSESWPRRFMQDGYHKYGHWTARQTPEQKRTYPFVFDPALQKALFAAAVAQGGAQTQRDVLNAYLTSLFNAWLDYQNLYAGPKQWVTAFDPRVIAKKYAVNQFFADYPDGLIVSIVREPASWLSSIVRHSPEETASDLLDSWSESTEAILREHQRRPDRVIVVLFENLVHQTEATMRMLAERMGMPFRQSLVEPTYNSMPVLSDSSYELVHGIDPKVTERHRETLTAEQQDLVAAKASDRYLEVRERFAIR